VSRFENKKELCRENSKIPISALVPKVLVDSQQSMLILNSWKEFRMELLILICPVLGTVAVSPLVRYFLYKYV